ncbi:MAG: M50 family metallopeptidase [Candidatus Berkelbacteria bacterium]|nr:M50 family metallopeptidase [Candidatus Berkelbacteria bacterium]
MQKQYIYYFLLFPGVIIHELSHVVGCILTGARIKDIQLFSKTGGFVVHEKPFLPYIGNFIISLLPLLAGAAISYFILKSQFFGFDLREINGQKIVYFYLLITILLTMFPSYQDIKNAGTVYFLLILTILIYGQKINLNPIFDNLVSSGLICVAILLIANLLVISLNSIKWK